MKAALAAFTFAAFLVAATSLAAPEAADPAAQQTPSTPTPPPTRQACRADFHKFCADVRPGSGRVAQCLLAHRDGLSPACRDTLIKVGAEHADKSDAGKPQ
jgi:hypothetical protein